jgi:branched-chain amino acid aminotransferase
VSEAVLWVNGHLLAEDVAAIDPRDRGWTLGDGLFETVRVRDGELMRWAAHVARLRAGAAVLGIVVPWSDGDLADIVAQTLQANALREAAVRLTLSRGVQAARGLLPTPDARPSLVVHAQPWGGYDAALYRRGMHAITSRIRRNEHSPLANIKSLCYLDNVLARQEAAQQGADEALLLNTGGTLACASAANLFVVVDGVLLTPPLVAGALPGTVRAAVLALAPQLDITVEEWDMQLDVWDRASEAFLTNALMGIMPLSVVDGNRIGGAEYPITARLQAALDRATS